MMEACALPGAPLPVAMTEGGALALGLAEVGGGGADVYPFATLQLTLHEAGPLPHAQTVSLHSAEPGLQPAANAGGGRKI